MHVVKIEPQNPLQLSLEDLTDFQSDLQLALPSVEVQLASGTAMPRGACGVTFWEVVHVYLPELASDARAAIVAIILEKAYQWAKRRFRRNRETTGRRDARPKCVVLHDEAGFEITSVVLLSARHKSVTNEEAASAFERKPHREKSRTTKSVKKKNANRKNAKKNKTSSRKKNGRRK